MTQHGAQVRMHEDEIDINAALVRRLLAEQFPHLVERSITVVRSTGTVNAIYRLGQDLYARLPRRQEWAESIDHEWTWLPKLAAHISLDIPKPLAKGKATDWYPCPWAIYQWIEGFPYYPKTNPEFVSMAKRTVKEILTDSRAAACCKS